MILDHRLPIRFSFPIGIVTLKTWVQLGFLTYTTGSTFHAQKVLRKSGRFLRSAMDRRLPWFHALHKLGYNPYNDG